MRENSLIINGSTGEMYLHDAIYVESTAFDTISSEDIPMVIGDRRWNGRGTLTDMKNAEKITDKTLTANSWNPTLTKEDVQGF